MIQHALTVDVEDWHRLMVRRLTGQIVPMSNQVTDLTETILDFLARRNTLATFFIVGELAEAKPDLVRSIAREGHEIATHGYAHLRVDSLSPELFRAEVKRSVAILEEVSGQRVLGHRAPEFSITRQSFWAFDVLAEEGLVYDSSIFPVRSRRYGIPDFTRRPCRMVECAGSLIEFPLATLELGGWRLPAAGGGYLRLLPYAITRKAVRQLERDGTPAVIYVHPYDFPGERLQLHVEGDSGGFWKEQYWLHKHNLGRRHIMQRLDQLLDEFTFGPVRELVDGI